MRVITSFAVVTLLAACGGDDNVADCEKGRRPVPCSERTAEEDARLALDERDFDRAIELLSQLVTDEPENYARYPLLSAALAGRAGVAILEFATSSVTGGDGGSSLTDQISAFLPDPLEKGDAGYALALTDVDAAIAVLNRIPTANLASTSSEPYASSAVFQLTLYQTAYAIMYLNKFAISAATGQFDPALLATMTDEDAVIILQSLGAAAVQQAGPEGEAVQAKVDQALADIQAQDGASNREKLQAFIRQGQQTP